MATRKPAASTITTALVYTRVSSDEQAREGVSLDNQLRECRQYAARLGWMLGTEYQDVMSGSRDDRPRYQELLGDVRRLRSEGQSVAVVVAALDRFGRKLLERVRCREELKALGVPVHSAREGGEVSDLVANVLGAVAQEEVRRLGERISHAKRHVMEGGWYPVGRLPWGYRLRDATPEERAAGAPRRVPDLDPLTAPYAREMFRRVAAGASVRAVTRWILSLPAPLRQGRSLTYPTVRLALSTATYAGRFADGTQGRWPPLIEERTWERVQACIAAHRHMPKQASGRFLLTGLARCPRCGRRMVGGSEASGRGARYRTYHCQGQRDGACGFSLKAAKADALVLGEVAGLLDIITQRDPAVQTALQTAWKTLQAPPSRRTGQARPLQQMAEQARQRLTRAAELYADGELDRAGYELLRDKARADLDAATVELEQLTPAAPPVALPPLAAVLNAIGAWAVALGDTDTRAARDVLGALVQQVSPVRVQRATYQVQIAWTALGEALRTATANTAERAA